MDEIIFIGANDDGPVEFNLSMVNRHGLITGATGTGKTVTLQILAEGFSAAGIPVLAADIKGDLSGIAIKGTHADFLAKRAEDIGLSDYQFTHFPTVFWDIFGEQGIPLRTTMTEIGPLMLSRLMRLSEAQEGALNIAFKLADNEGLALLDLKDLRALLKDLSARGRTLTTEYGNVPSQTIGAILRGLVIMEEQGAEQFFGEPALAIQDLMRQDVDGRGFVNILSADRLITSPRLYATLLLWLMGELFEQLPEIGDAKRPKLVFFFDEAHLLFDEASPALVQKIVQTVKLIRSKGVGIYFITQNPADVPAAVLAQLGNRIQHALRAYTPSEQKALKTAADSFRPNPKFNAAQAISQLGKGEALVSMLDEKAIPAIVERILIRPPSGQIGPVTSQQRREILDKNMLSNKYKEAIDRQSAYEILQAKTQNAPPPSAAPKSGRQPETITDRVIKNVAGSVGRQLGNIVVRQVGNAIFRGILGSLKR